MKVVYIEGNEPSELCAAINANKKVQPISFVARGVRCGAFCQVPEGFDEKKLSADCEPQRPRAAIEHDKKIAESKRKDERAAPKNPQQKTVIVDPGPEDSEVDATNVANSTVPKDQGQAKVPGPVVE